MAVSLLNFLSVVVRVGFEFTHARNAYSENKYARYNSPVLSDGVSAVAVAPSNQRRLTYRPFSTSTLEILGHRNAALK